MFVRTTRAGRAAALLTSGVLAVLLITGSASPRTTYHITDGETVRTVTGKADDTQGALALAGVTLSQRDRVTSQVQTDGSVAVTVERPVTTYEEQVVELLPPSDRQLIVLRYFTGKTQMQTAEVLGMTQVQVSRREKKILLRLREQLSD